jgi:hypothetical protein
MTQGQFSPNWWNYVVAGRGRGRSTFRNPTTINELVALSFSELSLNRLTTEWQHLHAAFAFCASGLRDDSVDWGRERWGLKTPLCVAREVCRHSAKERSPCAMLGHDPAAIVAEKSLATRALARHLRGRRCSTVVPAERSSPVRCARAPGPSARGLRSRIALSAGGSLPHSGRLAQATGPTPRA